MQDDTTYELTPRGYIQGIAKDLGCSDPEKLWDLIQQYCTNEMNKVDEGALFPALVFDGKGGMIMGAFDDEDELLEDDDDDWDDDDWDEWEADDDMEPYWGDDDEDLD